MSSTRSRKHSGVVLRLPRKEKRPADPREIIFNKGFGARLREARDLKQLTQERLAASLGVGYDAYKKYEYGSRSFPLYLLRDLSTFLDKSISWLLTGKG